MTSFWIRAGSALMFLAVAFGAFGAHALKGRLDPEMQAVFETSVRYHVYHALALFLIAWLSARNPAPSVQYAGVFFLLGIILFSGSLYALSISGVRMLGIITPFGGLSFLLGWLLLLFSRLA